MIKDTDFYAMHTLALVALSDAYDITITPANEKFTYHLDNINRTLGEFSYFSNDRHVYPYNLIEVVNKYTGKKLDLKLTPDNYWKYYTSSTVHTNLCTLINQVFEETNHPTIAHPLMALQSDDYLISLLEDVYRNFYHANIEGCNRITKNIPQIRFFPELQALYNYSEFCYDNIKEHEKKMTASDETFTQKQLAIQMLAAYNFLRTMFYSKDGNRELFPPVVYEGHIQRASEYALLSARAKFQPNIVEYRKKLLTDPEFKKFDTTISVPFHSEDTYLDNRNKLIRSRIPVNAQLRRLYLPTTPPIEPIPSTVYSLFPDVDPNLDI